MTDETEAAENDILSPRDRETMTAIKKRIGEYTEYVDLFALIRAGRAMEIDEGMTEIFQSFISDLKIKAFQVDLDEVSVREFCGRAGIMLRERDDWIVISFSVTPV